MAKKQFVKAIEQENRDKRTQGGIKKALGILTEKFKPSEIAKKLGISTQKWTSTKKQIEKGKLYNPDLKNLLNKKAGIKPPESKEQKAAREEFGLTRAEWEKQIKKIQREEKAELKRTLIAQEKELGYEVSKDGIYTYESESIAKKYFRHRREVKTLPSHNQAKNWLRKIGNVSAYFIIVKEKSKKSGQDLYKVYDIRSPKERRTRAAQKNKKNNGESRAQEIKSRNK
jgi:hypothetical protein